MEQIMQKLLSHYIKLEKRAIYKRAKRSHLKTWSKDVRDVHVQIIWRVITHRTKVKYSVISVNSLNALNILMTSY